MTGVSIEATLELWASLRDVKARMRPLFTQERVANSACQFLDGLLGEERRKTGWMRGKASCGVGRQYTGSAGKITNCQIGVFASYVSRHGHAFIDRALYLPRAWTEDRNRVPELMCRTPSAF
ncbi:SRSO17 transposase [Rhizobium leguminosarum]|uniref:SRSO17 transposase n=1 Tax=Rhizobium leguminosarum TaxID=384 RepID=A0AAE2MGL4_RHILE|nr:SRSO17 transposase [Rhizobium leguminosarum]MBB4433033.1 SRSO17 transposase [Rhizobium esperanzae]MBB4294839.1 SRSO17 transposase [Rhizobium leguminosarum]MBB4306232.1 SRSO17 transposase [Rhizobium leguminosarum]MBB4418187.1 SRSO17 transposase [Rhizobium leguminosarum]